MRVPAQAVISSSAVMSAPPPPSPAPRSPSGPPPPSASFSPSPASPLPSKALASPRAPPMSKRSLPTSATHKSSFGILSLCFSVTVPSSLLFPFFLVLILLFFALFCCFLYSARPPVRVCFFIHLIYI